MLSEIFYLVKNKNKRYERKFFITEASLAEVKSVIKIHPACFRRQHSTKRINNIYLDTFEMENYFDNLSGIGMRSKPRIRWYSGNFKKAESPTLEVKIRENMLISKLRYNIGDFDLDKNLDKTVKSLIKKADVPEIVKLYLSELKVSSINNYLREYYVSFDNKFRLTLDHDINFYNPKKIALVRDNSSVILELKYNKENDDKAELISNKFPFRMTKSSKYVSGVEKDFLSLEY